MGTERTFKVEALARVEGEGGMQVVLKDGVVEDVKLNIFEPPRFFEGFLQGRKYTEAPDITARICGICPVAYQMSSVAAMEDALGIKVEGQLRELRRLLYCGEWIESHVLHIYMLHAPDFLGYQDAIQLAADHREVVERGLRLKKLGNDIVATLAGREIHPINVRVGGWHRAPRVREFDELRRELDWGMDAAIETARWAATLDFPEFHSDHEYVALKHPDEYPYTEGRIVSTRGLDVAVQDYDEHFEELHIQHSTSLHGNLKARGPYFVGPQARYALCYDQLCPEARAIAREVGLEPTDTNPFKSIVIRAIETIHAIWDARRIIDQYQRPAESWVQHEVRAGVGHGASEAPRGILHHSYEIDDKGEIVTARIVPPTAANQPSVESDLRHFVERYADLPDEDLQWKLEQAIRNYDPCISCSCHFLKLDVQRL